LDWIADEDDDDNHNDDGIGQAVMMYMSKLSTMHVMVAVRTMTEERGQQLRAEETLMAEGWRRLLHR
jgi:hypothetical protein